MLFVSCVCVCRGCCSLSVCVCVTCCSFSTTQVGVLLLQCSAFVLSVVCQERVLRRALMLILEPWRHTY